MRVTKQELHVLQHIVLWKCSNLCNGHSQKQVVCDSCTQREKIRCLCVCTYAWTVFWSPDLLNVICSFSRHRDTRAYFDT